MNAKRRTKESQAGQASRSESSSDEELLAQLDHQLSRLPDKYRIPFVLCELEGKCRKEVARRLGLSEGTLSSRLAQAKKLLAKRLSRHELAIPLGVLAVGLSPTLRASTLKTVLTAGTVPAKVLALTEGVLKAMFLSKLKITACAGVLMVLAGVGVSGLTYRATAQEPKQLEYYKAFVRGNAESRSQNDELEALRLEIEALRKSLQATRERVKSLEDEVSALKGQRQGLAFIVPDGGRGGRPGGPPGQGPGTGGPQQGGFASQSGTPQGMQAPGTQPMPGVPQGMKPPGAQGLTVRNRQRDAVTDAENALKKLKENPGDKEATEALEKALQRLKERDAPGQPGEPKPGRP